MATTLISGVQYSGIWDRNSHVNAVAASTWPAAYNETTLFAWGINNGQLGLGDTTSRSSPVQVGSSNWLDLAGSRYATVAIKSNGTIFGAGSAATQSISSSSFVQIGSGTTWYSMSQSPGFPAFGFLIKSDGSLWSWGENGGGQLGLGNDVNYSSPKQIGALTNWLSVSASSYGGTAIKTNGTLWAWGPGSSGRLGDGTIVTKSSPVQIGALTTWSQVSGGSFRTTAAVKTDGTLWNWGLNSYGQLGDNTIVSKSSPIQVGGLTNWLYVSAGYYSVIALKTDGSLWTWGRNDQHGQLGLGNTTNYSSPKQIGALTTWSKVRGSTFGHILALKTDGTLWAWGRPTAGQLGNGVATAGVYSPVQIGSRTTWTNIGVGSYSSFAW